VISESKNRVSSLLGFVWLGCEFERMNLKGFEWIVCG